MDWQIVIVMAVVAAATGYLGRLAWLSIVARKAAACGGCDRCPSAAASEPKSLVGLEQLVASATSATEMSANGVHESSSAKPGI